MNMKISATKDGDSNINKSSNGLFLGVVFVLLLIGILALSLWVSELSRVSSNVNSKVESRLSILEEQLQLADFLGKHLETDIFKRSVEAIVRAANISYKYPNRIAKTMDQSALKLTEEKNFFTALQPILNSDQQARWNPENYLKQLHAIEPVVNRFFEYVMVMDEDPVKCGNRLWLCSQLAEWSGRYLDLRAIVFA